MKNRRTLLILVFVIFALATIACSFSVDLDLGKSERPPRRQPTQHELWLKDQQRMAQNRLGLILAPIFLVPFFVLMAWGKGVGAKTWIAGVLTCVANLALSYWVLGLDEALQDLLMIFPCLIWMIVFFAAWGIEFVDWTLKGEL